MIDFKAKSPAELEEEILGRMFEAGMNIFGDHIATYEEWKRGVGPAMRLLVYSMATQMSEEEHRIASYLESQLVSEESKLEIVKIKNIHKL